MAISKVFRRGRDKSQTIVFAVYFVIFLVFAFLCLYPLFWCLANSLKSTMEYYESSVALPEIWNFAYYAKIFTSFKIGYVGFLEMVLNSIWQTFGWQAINILGSICVAYPLARYKFPGRSFCYGIILFRITIPIVGSGAVAYKFLRAIGMINNPVWYSLTYFQGFDLAALILYGYFKGISREYSEAAYIDGATRLQVLGKVVLPLAMPCVIALFISNVMAQWNNYSTPMIYMTKYPNLAYGIYLFQDEVLFIENGMPLFFGAIIITSLVPLLLFTLGQKTMLTNMSVGGLKG